MGGHHLIFDAGTGIIPLGKKLLKGRRSPLRINLFLSHTHHDHVFGFYFFDPLFESANRIHIFGPNIAGRSLKDTLQLAMDRRFFPVGLNDIDARKEIYSLKGGERIHLPDSEELPKVIGNARGQPAKEVTVLAHKSHAHPNGVLLYRVCYRNKSIVYATDIEQRVGGYPDIIEFVRGTDLLIHDAQYLHSEYVSRTNSRKGWGHSTMERAAEVARKAGVKQLILFHHEPTHDDTTLERIEKLARRLFPSTRAAYEGMEVDLLPGRLKRK
ncbi:MAG TPA: MBL fold metallo-hydrolase [Candidatus Binatia bacterium]|nr:MBL fold metallo-hydrolase [Candidatus Binatia bacterium]